MSQDVQEGMFLDDIDTEDPGAVSHYFGVQTSRRSRYVSYFCKILVIYV